MLIAPFNVIIGIIIIITIIKPRTENQLGIQELKTKERIKLDLNREATAKNKN